VIRDVLLGVHAFVWAAVAILTAWRTGTVPAELWAALPLGIGALMGAFRADGMIRRRRAGEADVEDE
jgi:hypothetical protein